jgi:hypothetical protein
LVEQGSEVDRVPAGVVTPEVFSLLEAPFLIGGPPSRQNQKDAVVLSERFWKDRFGSRRDIVGATLRVEGLRNAIVTGVIPDRFPLFPLLFHSAPLFYLFPDENDAERLDRVWTGVGRIHPHTTAGEAFGEIRAALNQLKADYPRDYRQTEPSLVSLEDEVEGIWRPALASAMMAAALLVLAAATSLAALLLIRCTSRLRDFAIRRALGASLTQLRLAVWIEGFAVGVVGTLLSSALAAALIRVLPMTGARSRCRSRASMMSPFTRERWVSVW